MDPIQIGASRRRVVAVAWAAPVIVAASSAPAMASSPTATLTPSFDTNTFRATNDTTLLTGEPSTGGLMALAANVLVSGAAVTGLTCVMTLGSPSEEQGVGWYNNTSGASRLGTVWLGNNGSLAANGWSTDRPLPANAEPGLSGQMNARPWSTYTFVHAASAMAGLTVPLRMLFHSSEPGDFPITFQFSAPGVPTPAPLVVAFEDLPTGPP